MQSPYTWLVQALDVSECSDTSNPEKSQTSWRPLKPTANELLEAAIAKGDKSATVAIEHGRYDINLQTRMYSAVYWEEPQRKVLRSSWFYVTSHGALPYDEDAAERLEICFKRLTAGLEKAPLMVALDGIKKTVRFQILRKEEAGVMSTFMSKVPIPGGGTAERKSVFGVAADSIHGDPKVHYTACQLPADDADSQQFIPVFRGYAAACGAQDAEVDEETQIPDHVECLYFVIHGIGQYYADTSGNEIGTRLHTDVDVVRKLASKYMAQRQTEGRIEFLPLEWYEFVHQEVGLGNRLRDVTLSSVPSVRLFANFAVTDLLVYQDPEWREQIHDLLKRKMNRLYFQFKERTPNFTGKVGIIGHSLGGIIMFDLMQNYLPKFQHGLLGATGSASQACPDASPAATAACQDNSTRCPAPRCCFAVGCPLGMFMTLRLARRRENAEPYFRGLDVTWPAACAGEGWRLYNIFHPDDPVAYRVEPLLNPDYASVPPKPVPYCGGLRMHHQLREWWHAATNMINDSSSDNSPKGIVKPRKDADGLLVLSEEEKQRRATMNEDAAVASDDSPSLSSPVSSPRSSPRSSARKRGQGGVVVDRIDWAIQETAGEAINEFLSALHSHNSYWACEDLIHFVVDKTFETLSSKIGPAFRKRERGLAT